jgi:hypothetical protein
MRMESKTGLLNARRMPNFNRTNARGFQTFLRKNNRRHFQCRWPDNFSSFPADEYKSTPAGADPNGTVGSAIPMAANPDTARMRAIPVAANPNPLPAPFPNTVNPNEGRVRGDRPDFNLRKRRFAGLLHHDFGIRRRSGWRGRGLLDINRAVSIDHPAFHAAAQKRQRGGDQNSFDKN